MINLLLDGKADPNYKRPDGESALTIAVQRGSLSAVKSLVAGGADVNITDGDSQTCIMLSAQRYIYIISRNIYIYIYHLSTYCSILYVAFIYVLCLYG